MCVNEDVFNVVYMYVGKKTWIMDCTSTLYKYCRNYGDLVELWCDVVH